MHKCVENAQNAQKELKTQTIVKKTFYFAITVTKRVKNAQNAQKVLKTETFV